jgi:hypothetical protein
MRPFRAPRRFAAILALAAVAFTQAAVAMYACMLSSPAEAAMSCHDEAPPPSALCNAHCLADEQTVDQAKPLAAAAVVAPLLAVVEIDSSAPVRRGVRAEPVLAHAASPPLPILYHRFLN